MHVFYLVIVNSTQRPAAFPSPFQTGIGEPVMKLTRSALMILIAVLTLGQIASNFAQETNSTAKPDDSFRLPNYYGKLGVSDEQREKLKVIHQDYEHKLDALYEQMKKLLAERDNALEAELTPGQKLRLKELRIEAIKENSDEAKSSDSP